MELTTEFSFNSFDLFGLPLELQQKILLEYLKDEYARLECLKLNQRAIKPTYEACEAYKRSTKIFVGRLAQLLVVDEQRFNELMGSVIEDLIRFFKHERNLIINSIKDVQNQLKDHYANKSESLYNFGTTSSEERYSKYWTRSNELLRQKCERLHCFEDLKHLCKAISKVVEAQPRIKL